MSIEDHDGPVDVILGSDSTGGQRPEGTCPDAEVVPRADHRGEREEDLVSSLPGSSCVVDHYVNVDALHEETDEVVHLSHLRLGFVIDRLGASLLRSLLHLE